MTLVLTTSAGVPIVAATSPETMLDNAWVSRLSGSIFREPKFVKKDQLSICMFEHF